MTWLDIVDSAIKIGLGALLGGIFTFLLNKQAYVHEIKKEILLSNRQTLKDVSVKFENIHANVISLTHQIAREYDLYVREARRHINKTKSSSSKAKTKLPKQPDFYERRFDIAQKLLLDLYSLQGVLMLYGYKKMSAVIYDYTMNVRAVSPINETDKEESDIPDAENIQKFNDLRIKFYEAAQYYLDINNPK
jgi:hypothetical protein